MWKGSDSMCSNSTHGTDSALLPFFGMFIRCWHSKAVGFWKDWVHTHDSTLVFTFLHVFSFFFLPALSPFLSILASSFNPIYCQLQTCYHSLKGPEASRIIFYSRIIHIGLSPSHQVPTNGGIRISIPGIGTGAPESLLGSPSSVSRRYSLSL